MSAYCFESKDNFSKHCKPTDQKIHPEAEKVNGIKEGSYPNKNFP